MEHLTPSWGTTLEIYLLAYESGNEDERGNALKALQQMAHVAQAHVDCINRINEVIGVLTDKYTSIDAGYALGIQEALEILKSLRHRH